MTARVAIGGNPPLGRLRGFEEDGISARKIGAIAMRCLSEAANTAAWTMAVAGPLACAVQGLDAAVYLKVVPEKIAEMYKLLNHCEKVWPIPMNYGNAIRENQCETEVFKTVRGGGWSGDSKISEGFKDLNAEPANELFRKEVLLLPVTPLLAIASVFALRGFSKWSARIADRLDH